MVLLGVVAVGDRLKAGVEVAVHSQTGGVVGVGECRTEVGGEEAV